MRVLCKFVSRYAVTVVLVLSYSAKADAELFGAGDFFVVDHQNNSVKEYNFAGTLLSTRDISYPGTRGANRVGDAMLDIDGNLHVYNGIFQPFLSTVNATDGSQVDDAGNDVGGFSTSSTDNQGSVAAIGDHVFVNDINTVGTDSYGIVSFDRSNSYQSLRFATDFNPSDLAAGLNGRLYALGIVNPAATGTPNVIRVYDPASLDVNNAPSLVDEIELPTATSTAGLFAIAANESGDIFAATGSGDLLSLDAAGNITNSRQLSTLTPSLFDLDIRADGRLLVAGRGRVYLSDTSLAPATDIDIAGSLPIHAGFLEGVGAVGVPEPSTLIPMIAAVAFLGIRARRKP